MTAVGNGGTTSESAAYDAAGAMTCRALASASCTTPTPSGQTLSYDALRRLVSWQNGSTSSEQYAEDGEGTRVWRQTTSGAWTTTTVAILGLEEVTTSSLGGAPTATRYYALPGGVRATRDRTGLVYEANDQLGTPIAALNLASGITGEQLRAPYGQARYAAAASGGSGGLRTPYGFTGQREDTTPSGSSGLDDFNARMYDPVVGRFTSADTAQPGLGDPSGQDGYAYVGGRVENATDPSGNQTCTDEVCSRGAPPSSESSRDSGDGGWGGVVGIGIAIAVGVDIAVHAIASAASAIAASGTTSTPEVGIPANLPDGSDIGLGPEGVFNQRTYTAAMETISEAPRNRASPKPVVTITSGDGGGSGGSESGTGTGTGSETPTQLPLPGFEPSETEGNANGEDCQAVAVQYGDGDQCAIERVEINGGASDGVTFQTYIVTNSETGEVYAGRTSGTGSPMENIARRFRAGHPATGGGWGRPVLDVSTTIEYAQRGREQLLIEYYRAMGVSYNIDNGVGPRNANHDLYFNAALDLFGPILEDPRVGR